MQGLRRLFAVPLVALGGLAAGFVVYRAGHPTVALHAADPTAAASPEDTPPPARPVPLQIPAVQLPDLTGHTRSLRDFLGRPLIVNFWATWCEPCRREMPLLSQLQQQQGTQLHIVGVAVDFQDAVQQYLQHDGVSYPVLVGEDAGLAAVEQFGMQPVLPFSVFADAQGHIVTVKVGELHRDDADAILGAMRALAEGRETLQQTRAHIASQLQALAVARSVPAASSAHKAASSPPN